jgi:hypothetical protein
MRTRVDIHWESDGRAIELWVSGYAANGDLEYCHSCHEPALIAHALALAAQLARYRQQTTQLPLPFP